jgi:hypothetical protein
LTTDVLARFVVMAPRLVRQPRGYCFSPRRRGGKKAQDKEQSRAAKAAINE